MPPYHPYHPYLPFAEYRFMYQAIDLIKIPPFPGRLLHGAFGNALKKNVCVLPDKQPKDTQCNTCVVKAQCAYTLLFKRQYLAQEKTCLQHTQSSPFVFRYDNQAFLQIPEKHEFSIKLLVIGSGIEQIDYLIDAMQSLGELGISHKKAELVSIEQMALNQLPVVIQTPHDHLPASVPSLPEVPDSVMIRFITPYNMNDDVMKKPFDMRYWLMGVIRRISRLQRSYTEQASSCDFMPLKALCDQAQVSHPSLYFYETPQTKRTHTSGILGSIELSMQGIEALWPWLYLGQWIHNGKKTSNGNGRYQLVVV